MEKSLFLYALLALTMTAHSQTLTQTQMRNARATGYAIVAARNPGQSFSINMIPWDGVNTLESNANTQINSGWHAQAAIKGNFFSQNFDGSDFSEYSSVVLSQQEFDQYKNTGTQWWIVCSTLPPFASAINSNGSGNVGIGTANPDAKLAVKGHIHTQEVRVDMTGSMVPDYVFEENYSLRPLTDVQTYIHQHKHLPEVPAAAAMEANGVRLGEMNMLLLKKIEELTLYMLEQNSVNKKQAREIDMLKTQLAEIINK